MTSSFTPVPSGTRGFRLAQEREFHKYYPHRSSSSDLSLQYQSQAPRGTTDDRCIRPCRDTALAAFAQLGALRLNARRAIISLFDRTHQHVLAEATKTLSLQSDTVHELEDRLWLGVRVIPREDSVCSHVTSLPVPHSWKKGNMMTTDGPVLIVSDIRADERFQQSTFVKDTPDGIPHARFYAGVPIVSPKGMIIGSYCILDDEPRDHLDAPSLQFLRDMAMTVMNHLAMARSKDERRRGERMIDGLGSFIEGEATLRGSKPRKIPTSNGEVAEGRLDARQQSLQDALNEQQSTSDECRDTLIGSLPQPHEKHGHGKPAESKASDKKGPDNPKNGILSTGVEQAFARAANILRESIEVQGVVFFDASISSYGGRVHSSADKRVDPDQASDSRVSSSDDGKSSDGSITRDKGSRSAGSGSATGCQILGFSTSTASSINGDKGFMDKINMRESFLQSLLRRYPQGKIFNFNENGSLSSGETSDGIISNTKEVKTPAPGLGAELQRRPVRKKKTREEKRRDEAANIISIFPGARSVAFLPMWDSHRARWFAGTVAWTCTAERIFTAEMDLLFLYAFGNSLMAEVNRLDAEMKVKQHATLVSSISHELRSPLHGILGNSQLLYDTQMNSMQLELTNTIESCGQTLLDVINHLLDFAKIDHLMAKPALDKQKSGSKSPGRRSLLSKAAQNKNKVKAGTGMISLTETVELDAIVEEVLDAIYAGHCFYRVPKWKYHGLDTVMSAEDRRTSTDNAKLAGLRNNVSIILDIDKDVNWKFDTQPGAWRRILMNIFGNALKHTDSGFIHVSVRSLPLHGPVRKEGLCKDNMSLRPVQGDEKSRLLLTVKDTGSGISKEYLENHIFTPFSQENPLSPGNGLGLSIVRQTIQSLGGEVNIRSTVGTGTDVSISLDLDQLHANTAQDKEPSSLKQAQQAVNGKTIGFMRFSLLPEGECDAQDRLQASFKAQCEHWFGMKVKIIDMANDDFQCCDYYFVTQTDAGNVEGLSTHVSIINRKKKTQCLASPLIALCNMPSDVQAMIALKRECTEPGIIEVISQPCGPRKLAKALNLCLARRLSPTEGSGNVISETVHDESGIAEPETTSEKRLQNGDDECSLPMGRVIKKSKHAVENPELDIPGSPTKLTTLTLQPPKTGKNGKSSPLTVLIVDDNKINMQLLVALMKKEKYPHATATNGLEALEAFKADPGRFGAILMDITMPVMDGLTATREIRRVEQEYHTGLDTCAKESWKPATIVAVTGLASASIQQEAFSSGIDLFLAKPIRFQELRVILESSK
ncbi:hypothetical protein MW887_003096 [Aspergillus wentii]|nr:hypothetical protein MW887_003096 [Aspergillus wentii]